MKQSLPFLIPTKATKRDVLVPANHAPSVRIRPTAANRSLLRWLRAAELTAWQEADPSPRRALKYFPN